MARRSADPLHTYRQKRRFDATPEPAGDRAAERGRRGEGMFVVQKHDATRLHYDFRLELDGVLKSWAVTRGPSLNPADKRLAVETEDHPLDYSDFEGTIPKGNYGAGTVMVWDTGHWRPLGDPKAGLKAGNLKFELMGQRLKGRWALVLMRAKSDAKRRNWLLIKERDDAVDTEHVVLDAFKTSVLSGRGLDAIAKAAPASGGRAEQPARRARAVRRASLPAFQPPALATLVESVPDGSDWLYEIKFDGYRALVACAGQEIRIFTRSGQDWTDRFPKLVAALAALDLDGALLDGEIVAVGPGGATDFSALVARLKQGDDAGLCLFVFDILRAGGRDLRGRQLLQRKAELAKLLAKAPKDGPVFYVDHLRKGGARMLASLCQQGFEGIVAKRVDAPYPDGRSKDWRKIKGGRDQEFIVVGYRRSKRDRQFASLLLAVREGSALRYAGRVGAGFKESDQEDLSARLAKLGQAKPSAGLELPPEIRRDAHWVKPRLVVAIAFAGFTGDGLIRQGSFKGLRLDKPAKDVAMERPAESEAVPSPGSKGSREVAGVHLTHADRVLYARQKITKLDLARYYEAVGSLMLPYVKERPASLVRCPEGPTKACFFQKHLGQGLPPAFKSRSLTEADGSKADYLYVDDLQGLVSLAQAGALEFHIWGSKAPKIEQPDRLVFDLDPDPSVGFADVRQAARLLRQHLGDMGLESFPLLSGGKGIHVVLPIRPRHPWPIVSGFCKALAQRLAREEPDRYVATMSKAKRKGRIFIDYLRNQRGSTAIAPYSTRAHEGAPVAWPVGWDELDGIARADAVKIGQAMQVLADRPDPWAGYADLRQGLTAKILAKIAP